MLSEPFTVDKSSNLREEALGLGHIPAPCQGCWGPFELGDRAVFDYRADGGHPYHERCLP